MEATQAQSLLRLTAEELERIAPLGVAREFRARTVVVARGDLGDSLYFILEGRLRVFLAEGEGRELLLGVLGPGEYFGDLAGECMPRSASVATMEACRLLLVPRARFAQLIATDAEFAGRFIAKLAYQVRALTDRLGNIALLGVRERVSRLLSEEGDDREERLTQSEIARRVGCSREMVSRALKDLARREK